MNLQNSILKGAVKKNLCKKEKVNGLSFSRTLHKYALKVERTHNLRPKNIDAHSMRERKRKYGNIKKEKKNLKILLIIKP